MHGTREIIQEASCLPVEERAVIVDSLLRSLNVPDPLIEREWIAVAHRRLDDLLSGRVKGVSGKEVFSRLSERFAQ